MDEIWREYNREEDSRRGILFYRGLVVALVVTIVCVWGPLIVMIVS